MHNKTKSNYTKHLDFMILDIICLILSYVAATKIRLGKVELQDDHYTTLFILMVLYNVLVTFLYEPYKDVLKRDILKEIKATLGFDLLSLSFAIIYLFVIKDAGQYSRLVMAYTYVIYFISSLVIRLLWKKHLFRKASNALDNGNQSLLIVCKNKDAEDIINKITKNNFEYHAISGLCIIDENLVGKSINGYPVVANIDSVLSYVSTSWIDDIFVGCSYNSIPKDIMEGFMATGIPIHIKFNNENMFEGRVQSFNRLGSYSVITATKKENKTWQLVLKKLMDILGGLVGSLIAVILIVIIGPIIYIKSPGNIIYTSKRVGKNGRVFDFYKFRSMVLNADDLKKDLAKKNRVKDGMMFKIENDPRIIPGIGNFIRKTSLDEFPQFFNVLKGDMSLVGTRPPTMDEWEKYTPYYRSRMSTNPGITGMWQVSGRSEITNFNEVVKLDNEYIDNWSIGLDIKILFKTVIKLFVKDKGAM